MNVSESEQYESVTDCNAISELVLIPSPIQGDPTEEWLHSRQSLQSMLKSFGCYDSSYQGHDSMQEEAAYMGKRFTCTLVLYVNLSLS